jgi:hypothetical protein
VIAGAILGALIVILLFVCMFLTGAAKEAHRTMVDAQSDSIKLAEKCKQMSEELARKPPLMISDETAIKLATMINNIREKITLTGEKPTAWKN